MARLILKSDGFNERVFDLKLGVNRVGRSPETDLQIEHATVSSVHCEVSVVDGEILVRDCESTNGTFFRGEPVREIRLGAGQTFSVGEVELFIESADVSISIPKIEAPARPAPPVVRTDGSMICPRHEGAPTTHRCTYCSEVMCDDCVKRLRRRGGKALKLCPLCSHPVQRIGEKKEKKSILGFLQKTVKMPFLSSRVDK